MALSDQQHMALATLSGGGSVTAAAIAARVEYRQVLAWRAQDEDFATAWSALIEARTDEIEDEALRVALEGYTETTTTDDGEGGVEVRTAHKRDPSMIRYLLSARRRGIYGQRSHLEHSGEVLTKLIDWGPTVPPSSEPDGRLESV